jgi:hypothetical protein
MLQVPRELHNALRHPSIYPKISLNMFIVEVPEQWWAHQSERKTYAITGEEMQQCRRWNALHIRDTSETWPTPSKQGHVVLPELGVCPLDVMEMRFKPGESGRRRTGNLDVKQSST